MRRAAGFIVAFALTVLALGSTSAMAPEQQVPDGRLSEQCGCPMIQSARVTPAAPIGPPVNYTLYGHAIRGWGLSNATISDPGPNITVYLGDVVTFTLAANDTQSHNWFLDYNDNREVDTGIEPSSPDFNTLTGPKVVVWNFTADRPGTWTYRCRFHPTTMIGTLEVRPEGRPLNQTLSGNAIRGWGTENATISNPGPEIVVGVDAVVTLTLMANDTAPHNWFIDYNNNSLPDAGEPISPDFNTLTGPKVVVWNFTADRPGQFTYRCGFHPTSMVGTIIVLGEERRPGGGPPAIGLIPGILLISLGGVLVFAASYHVRAVRAAKRRK